MAGDAGRRRLVAVNNVKHPHAPAREEQRSDKEAECGGVWMIGCRRFFLRRIDQGSTILVVWLSTGDRSLEKSCRRCFLAVSFFFRNFSKKPTFLRANSNTKDMIPFVINHRSFDAREYEFKNTKIKKSS